MMSVPCAYFGGNASIITKVKNYLERSVTRGGVHFALDR
jgi:hypothetical protein